LKKRKAIKEDLPMIRMLRGNMPEDAVPIREAAKIIGVYHLTIHRWVTEGLAGGVKLRKYYRGGRVYISPSDVEAFFQAVQDKKDRQNS